MTDSPTARLISEAIDASGKTQTEIAREIGFERSNVISMLKTGLMRMPIERIPAFSRATGIDPTLLTRVAMTEYMPETWNVITGPTQAFPEAQINIRGAQPTIERFKQICHAERRTYFDMLSRMVDLWEARFDRLIEEQRECGRPLLWRACGAPTRATTAAAKSASCSPAPWSRRRPTS